MSETDQIIASTARELKVNPPKILARTASKFGAARAEKQRRAILLNKARNQGAKVPKLASSNGGGY